MTRSVFYKKDGDDYVETDAFSQTDVDDILAKRLERERGKFADYDDLKAKASQVEAIKSEYEEKLTNLGTEKSELEQKLQKQALEVDKVKIIHEYKLSDDLAEFLDGKDAEDMRAKAEKLSRGITGGVSIDKQEKPQGETTDSAKIAKTLFGKSSD